MSTISDAMTTALDALATAKGESLQYATTLGGSYTAMSGFVLHQDLVSEPVYNEHDRADSQSFSATLKGPVTPALAVGYEVKDTVTGLRWAVESVMVDVQQICRLMRRVERTRGPNRGGAA
jgi:hypothetical protein